MARRKRRGVRVRRVIRRFEIWPVAKVAFLFHLCSYLMTMVALWGLWVMNDRLGTVDKIEELMTEYGFGDNFVIDGRVLLRGVASGGAVLAVLATMATIALALFYNAISLIFGGLVVSVLEERRPDATATASADSSAQPVIELTEVPGDSVGAASEPLSDPTAVWQSAAEQTSVTPPP